MNDDIREIIRQEIIKNLKVSMYTEGYESRYLTVTVKYGDEDIYSDTIWISDD